MIRLVKSTFYKEELVKKQLCKFIMKADQLSMGPECKKYEEGFAKKQKRKYAVFVANGSVANVLLIQSLLNLGKLKKGDKIGFSSLTWATNTMPIIQLGLEPVAIDCEVDTLCVSPKTLEKYIKKIKCLFITNVLGFSDDIEEIKKMCEKHKVLLLEDNCESLGSQVNKKLLGNFGLASTFSHFVGHHVSTIEGGLVCTDDKDLYNMMVMVRAHGWDRNLSPADQNKLRRKFGIDKFYAKYTFYDLAYNFRPTEISGFLGNAQLKYWDVMLKKREKNFKLFNKAIQNNPDFIPFKLDHMSFVSNMAMPVVCKTKELLKKYVKKFEQNEIEVRPVIAGDITQQPFYKKYKKKVEKCENAAFVHENGFYFANNPELTKDEVGLIIRLLLK